VDGIHTLREIFPKNYGDLGALKQVISMCFDRLPGKQTVPIVALPRFPRIVPPLSKHSERFARQADNARPQAIASITLLPILGSRE